MNMTPTEAAALAERLKNGADTDKSDVIFCVPATDIYAVSQAVKGSNISVGAQNMFFEDNGAYTGEISANMLLDMGVRYVIIGHSERRELFAETNETVNKKVLKAFEKGIVPIMCVGESLVQREKAVTIEWIRMQVKVGLFGVKSDAAKKLIIAYEPIWAIGTGKTATSAQAQEVCSAIRAVLAEIYDADTAEATRVQYGGSVTGANAGELFGQPDIDGGLVGGASLKDDFIKIVNY
jgi:triosephosphate isomerase